MYSPVQLALKYIRYYFSASNGKGHGMHSPFVFELITKVLNDKRAYPAYTPIENLRRQLLKDTTVLELEDFGAGSAHSKTNRRTVASIAKNAAKPAKFGQLLYRLVSHFQPAVILELGTSLGITSAYLASGHTTAKLITMEGAPAVLSKANENFAQLQLTNIETIAGNFDATVPALAANREKLDFIFIDGNHRKAPTLRYFEQLLPLCTNNTVLVFDDIHWSREMEEAWALIQKNPAVTCSVDLFFVGLVFLRNEIKEQQHFTIRF
jgi:predicted O-methyltransferase YrrM